MQLWEITIIKLTSRASKKDILLYILFSKLEAPYSSSFYIWKGYKKKQKIYDNDFILFKFDNK